jgi:cysteine protease ATG4
LNDSPLWIYSSHDGLIPTNQLLKIVERRTLLLLLPLRLGLQQVNSLYAGFIAGCLQLPASVGIVGGLPGRSLYFVGGQESDLLFLDPHILRPTPFSPDSTNVPDLVNEFHTDMVRSIPIKDMDPSMLFGFVCGNGEEVLRLKEQLETLNRTASILNIQ